MNRLGLAQIMFLLAALTQGRDLAAARFTLDFDIDGVSRKVLVYAPDQPGTGVTPVLIAYHGRGDDSVPFANAVKLHRDWPQAIVAYPKGEMIDTTPPMRGWQYRAGTYQDRDLKLTDQLLARLGERYRTQPEHSYAAGFSNGGHFVFLLNAERNDRFAAFIAIGALQPDYASDAPPKPFLYLFGRREDPSYQPDWARTVQALTRHNRSEEHAEDFASCCKVLRPAAGGALLAFGLYNAGHIWPSQGNDWLLQFLELNGENVPARH
jgi:polyhydroxybutyrate depolymerase